FSRVQNLVGRQVVAKRVPIEELPNDFFLAGYFEDLRVIGARVRVGYDDVAVRQRVKLRYPEQLDAGKLVLIDFPNDLALRVHFEHTIIIAAADERVAAWKP